MRKLMVALAAAGALALAGCSSDSASTTESSAPATDAAVTVTDAWIPQPASDTSAMFGTITNSGTEAVTLTTGSVEGVGMVQVHEFVTEDNKQGTITLTLKYQENGTPVIAGLKRVSKPGLRIYTNCEDMPKVMKGLGTAIISTSKGVMTDKAARAAHVGGEVLAFVW